MAPRLRWWVGGSLLACLLIGASFLPPRGIGVFGSYASLVFRTFRPPQVTPANQRRMDLEAAWRSVDNELKAEQFRRQVEPTLAARRAADDSRPVLLLSMADSVQRQIGPMVASALDSVWRQLDIGVSKVATVLVIRARESVKDSASPRGWSYSRIYLLPDSTDRTTCLVMLPAPYVRPGRVLHEGYVQRFLRSGLGPCAFYARFGAPGVRVRSWLAQNHFDMAESSNWTRLRQGRLDDEGDMDDILTEPNLTTWRMWYVYSMNFQAVACLAGRAAACRSAIREGDDGAVRPVPRAVTPGVEWRTDESRVRHSDQLLAEVFKQSDEASFQEFWTTTLPVDSALSLVVGEPIGDWTARWQSTFGFQPRLGAAPPWSSVWLGFLLIGAMAALVAWASRWRQVR